MYGKHFESCYTGSMVGMGAIVFAVWGYVIAYTVKSRVELNPRLLAAIIGEKEKDIEGAIAKLCAPDPKSRNKEHQGRKLIREGEYQYFVTGWEYYSKIRNQDERREYQRTKQAEYRLKKRLKNNKPLPGEQAFVKAYERGEDPNPDDYLKEEPMPYVAPATNSHEP